MNRPHGFWNENDPVEYFRHKYSHITSRMRLKKEDGILYDRLRILRMLDELIPNKNKTCRNYSEIDPVELFHEKYSHVKSRGQLEKEDSALSTKLRRIGKLDEIFPGTANRNFSKIDPVQYFKDNYSHVESRLQLAKEDKGLYEKLRKIGKLDEILPEPDRRNWNKINPVELFREKYSHIASRKQLQKEDSGLYEELRKIGKLDEVLPETLRRNFSQIDPVALFHEKYSHITSRSRLQKEDGGLYLKLRILGKLDEVLPETLRRNFSHVDPVELFHEKYSHISSRGQLSIDDSGLYCKLLELGKLDEVLPSRSSKKAKALEEVVKRIVEE